MLLKIINVVFSDGIKLLKTANAFYVGILSDS